MMEPKTTSAIFRTNRRPFPAAVGGSMDIRQLRSFLVVCEYGSITQGAQHLFVSPQALSRTIFSLEQELNTALFNRTPQGIVLTDAGKHLRKLVQPIVDAMDDATRQMNRMFQDKRQTLSIGITSALQYFLPESDLALFRQDHPNCVITVNEHSHEECEAMLSKNLLSAALLWSPVNKRGIRTIMTFQRQRVCIIPADHPLAQKEVVHIRDLAGLRLVTNMNSHGYNTLQALCRAREVEPEISRVADSSTLLYMCEHQRVVGLSLDFMLLSRPITSPGLVTRPVSLAEFPYTIQLVTSLGELSETEQMFLDFLQELVSRRNLDSLPPASP